MTRRFSLSKKTKDPEEDGPQEHHDSSAELPAEKKVVKKIFRKKESPRKPRFFWVLYALIVVLLLGCGGGIYVLWFRSFHRSRPELAAAQPWVYSPSVKVEALRLWWEESLPRTGNSIPPGREPRPEDIRRVKTGDGLGGGKSAPEPGFFLPWMDGFEEEWTFSSLWRQEVPMLRKYTLWEGAPGRTFHRGGRFVRLPQELRLIFRVPRSPRIEKLLLEERIDLASEPRGRPLEARIKAVREEGSFACVLVALPAFPRDALLSRRGTYYLRFPEEVGVRIPQSAVDFRKGVEGVYRVTGGEVLFRKVTGKPMDSSCYLVLQGLRPGELVMKHAQRAEEGRLRIW